MQCIVTMQAFYTTNRIHRVALHSIYVVKIYLQIYQSFQPVLSGTYASKSYGPLTTEARSSASSVAVNLMFITMHSTPSCMTHLTTSQQALAGAVIW